MLFLFVFIWQIIFFYVLFKIRVHIIDRYGGFLMSLRVDNFHNYNYVSNNRGISGNSYNTPSFKAKFVEGSQLHNTRKPILTTNIECWLKQLLKDSNNFAEIAQKNYGNKLRNIADAISKNVAELNFKKLDSTGESGMLMQNPWCKDGQIQIFSATDKISPDISYLRINKNSLIPAEGKIITKDGEYTIKHSDNVNEFELWQDNNGISYYLPTMYPSAFMTKSVSVVEGQQHPNTIGTVSILEPKKVVFNNGKYTEVANGKKSVITNNTTGIKEVINMKKAQNAIDSYSSFIEEIKRQLLYPTGEPNSWNEKGYEGKVYDAVSNYWYTAKINELTEKNGKLDNYTITLVPEEHSIDYILLPDGSKPGRLGTVKLPNSLSKLNDNKNNSYGDLWGYKTVPQNNSGVRIKLNHSENGDILSVESSTEKLIINPAENEIDMITAGFGWLTFNPRNGAVLGKLPTTMSK